MVTISGRPGALHVPRKGKAKAAPARIIIDKDQLLEDELEGTVKTTPESDNSSNGSNASSLNSQEEDDEEQELKGTKKKTKTASKTKTATPVKLGSIASRFGGSSAHSSTSSSSCKKAPVVAKTSAAACKQEEETAAAGAIPKSSLKGSTGNAPTTSNVQEKPELQGILRDYYYNENNVLVHRDAPKITTPVEQRVNHTVKRSKSSAGEKKVRRGKRPERRASCGGLDLNSDDEEYDNDPGCDSDEGSFDGGPVGSASPRSVIATSTSDSNKKKAFAKPRLEHKDSVTGESAFAASDSGSDSDGGDIRRRGSSGSDGSPDNAPKSRSTSMSRAQKLQAMRRASSNSLCSANSDSSDSECPYRSSFGCGNAVLTIDSPSCAKLKLSAVSAAGFIGNNSNHTKGGPSINMAAPNLNGSDDDENDHDDDGDTDGSDDFASSSRCSKGSNKGKVKRNAAANGSTTISTSSSTPKVASIPKKKHQIASSSRLMSPRRSKGVFKDAASNDNDSSSNSEANKNKKPAALSPRQLARAKTQQKQQDQDQQQQQQQQGSSSGADEPVWKFDLSALEKSTSAEPQQQQQQHPAFGRKESIHRIRPQDAAAAPQAAASMDPRTAERAARLAKAKERVERENKEKQRIEDEIAAEKKRKEEEEEARKCNSEEYRRDLAYQWYSRCGMPSRSNLKMRISQIQSCEITERDVDLLPWMGGGSMVNVGAMIKLQKPSG